MRRSMLNVVALLSAAVGLQACSDDSSDEGSGGKGAGGTGGSAASGGTAGSSGSGTGGSGTGGTGTGGTGGSPVTLCEKYGGSATVDGAIRTKVIPEIAGDCRINVFFTSLSADGLAHVTDCLSIQAQELFQCQGVTYAGSEDSKGVRCRSMTQAHEGLGISQADFDALIEDVAAGLKAAGVEDADIAAAAPALLGMQDAIVESESTEPTMPACDGGTP